LVTINALGDDLVRNDQVVLRIHRNLHQGGGVRYRRLLDPDACLARLGCSQVNEETGAHEVWSIEEWVVSDLCHWYILTHCIRQGEMRVLTTAG
jgi:hypothetical protein